MLKAESKWISLEISKDSDSMSRFDTRFRFKKKLLNSKIIRKQKWKTYLTLRRAA